MTRIDPISAVVLAGGMETRLKSAVSDRPKVLAPVRGRPFLSYLLDHLVNSMIDRIIISTGFMAESIEKAFGNDYRGTPLIYSREQSPLGTGGALRLAFEKIHSDPVLVLNGDSYCGFDLADFAARHRANHAAASILLAEVPDISRFGRVQIDTDGQVRQFEEKGNASGAGWINAGVYLLSQAGGLSIPAKGVVSLEREIFPAWIGKGLFGVKGIGPFIDIGTPESYQLADAFFAGK